MHLVFSGMWNSSFWTYIAYIILLSFNFTFFLLVDFGRIDTENDIATTLFGKVSEEKNKFKGGILLNGTIYAIPSNAKHILCIDTNKGGGEGNDDSYYQNRYNLIGNLPPTKDKWQGKQEVKILNYHMSVYIVHVGMVYKTTQHTTLIM